MVRDIPSLKHHFRHIPIVERTFRCSLHQISWLIYKSSTSRAPYRLGSKQIPAPQQLKMEELDAILSKYTSEVTNHLQGATFVAVNVEGSSSNLFPPRNN
jgi:hypothetical protein